MRAILQQQDPLTAAVLGDPLHVERDVASDVHEEDGFRPVRARLALEVLERHAEIVAVAVHELDLRTCGHDRRGVAMNVFDGQSTVCPRTEKNSSAASAAPVQLEVATDGNPFHSDQACSNWTVSGPSDHCSVFSAESQSSWRRLRSR